MTITVVDSTSSSAWSVGVHTITITTTQEDGTAQADHGSLLGLADDDHPHYLNTTRGDARYTAAAHATDTANPHGVTAAQVGADASGTAAAALATHTSTYNHALLHAAVTAGTGISVTGQQVTNSDTGSAAVATHLAATDPHGIAAATMTLTNKSITDYSNTVHADAIHYRVKNVAGVTLSRGMPVAFSGYNSGENAIEIVKANQATGVAIGIVEDATIANGSFGQVVAAGVIEGVNTSGYTAGAILFVDGAGALTATEPTSGYSQPIAFVLRNHATVGAIQVLAAYPKQSADDVRYTAGVSVYSALSGHIGNTSNPHSVTVAQIGAIAATEMGAASGVATLDATTRVPTVQLATGTADNTKFLRGDGTWSVPADLGAGIGSLTFYKADGTQDDIDLTAATSLTTLEVTGEFNMASAANFRVGTAFGWRDLMGPIEARGNSSPTWAVFRNGIYGYAFPSNSSKEAFIVFHIDHDYAVGTNLYPHIHFSSKTTSAGVVRFGIEWTVAKGHQQSTGSIFGATTTTYVEATLTATVDQYKHFVLEVGDAAAIPSTNVEVDGLILMRIFRDTASANDTFPDDIFVWQADLHYQTAKFATKNKAPNFYA